MALVLQKEIIMQDKLVALVIGLLAYGYFYGSIGDITGLNKEHA